jgi:mono/diheme cytochrome c family protein
MNALIALSISLAAAAMVVPLPASAAQQSASAAVATAPRTAERELIPGAHLMTSAEREHYRARMQGATHPDEKARIRSEQVKAMDARARGFGLSLRDSVPAPVKGDVSRGAALHNVCFSCHGPERYTAAKARSENFLADALIIAGGVETPTLVDAATRAPASLPSGYPQMARSKIRDVAGLKRAVLRWNDYFNPKLTDQELEDLVAYLNASYYKF